MRLCEGVLVKAVANYSESVVEGEGKTQALLDMNYGMFVINKNVEENPGLMQASIDFLKFLYKKHQAVLLDAFILFLALNRQI